MAVKGKRGGGDFILKKRKLCKKKKRGGCVHFEIGEIKKERGKEMEQNGYEKKTINLGGKTKIQPKGDKRRRMKKESKEKKKKIPPFVRGGRKGKGGGVSQARFERVF